MSVSRKAINTLILAPLIGMTMLTAQPAFYGGDAAYAQRIGNQSSLSVGISRDRPSTPTKSRDDNSGSENILIKKPGIPPCPPGTAPTPNCRPWTPPTTVVQSADECQCKMRRVNGVMMKDCYVLLRNLVHYCKAGHLVRR